MPRILCRGSLLRRPVLISCLFVLLGSVVVVGVTFRDFGMTWDEGVQLEYGVLVLDYFRSGFQDTRANEYLNLYLYGPFFEVAAALLDRGDPEAFVESRHLFTALVGLLGVAAVMYVAGRLGPWLAPVAGLAFLTMPRFWGHLFANSKDVPFATGFALTLAALALWSGKPHPDRRHMALLVAAAGLTAAVRPGGLPLLLLVVGLVMVIRCLQQDGSRADPDRWLRQLAIPLGIVLVGAWAIMVAAWPWAHGSPILHPLAAMFEAARFSTAIPVLFDGVTYSSDALPLRYLPQFLLITTPIPMILLAAIGAGVSVRHQLREPRSVRALHFVGVQAWLLVPLTAYLFLRPNMYDGIRHFLFLLAPVAILASVGMGALVSGARGRVRLPVAMACAVALVSPLPDLVRLHPYQASYFNALVGGLAGAEGRFETDYWASSYREAVQWLNDRAEEQGALRVMVAANHLSFPSADTYATASVRLEPVFGLVSDEGLPAGVDYYLATYRYGLDQNFRGAPVVHSVGRDGAVFAVIRGRSAAAEP